jgi:hypothetical protein
MGEDELLDADNTLCLPTILPLPHLSSTVVAEAMMSFRYHCSFWKDAEVPFGAIFPHRRMLKRKIGGGIVQARIQVKVVSSATNPLLPP